MKNREEKNIFTFYLLIKGLQNVMKIRMLNVVYTDQ